MDTIIASLRTTLLNWNTLLGKIEWAIVMYVWKKLWGKFNSLEAGVKKQIATSITGIIGAVLLLVLLSQITESISGSITDQQRPDFKLTIMNPGLSDSNPRTHVLAIDAKIWNDGGQSVVVGWGLKIIGPDKKSFQFPQMVVAEGTNTFTTTGNDGSSRVFRYADSFQSKAGETPIVNGGMQSGYVLFQISDTARDFLTSPNVTYEISCMDTHGKTYSCSFNWPAPSK